MRPLCTALTAAQPLSIPHTMNPRFLSTAALLAALIFAGCSGADTASEEAPTVRTVRVETMVIQPTTFDDLIEVTGTVDAMDDAVLSAQSAGTVTSLKELGTFIPAGGGVAQLDPQLVQAALNQAQAVKAQAQAQYDLAMDTFRRQESLYRDSIISALEFENIRTQRATAQASVAQAQAAVAQAERQLALTRVTSPFGGTVEEHFVQRGEQVSPGVRVARVVSTGRVKVTAGVPERFAGDVAVGDAVEVRLDAYGGEARTGRITFVGSAVDPASRTFPIEVELNNAEGRLKPSMVATVAVRRARIERALVVPRAALQRDEDGQSLYVAVRTDSAIVAQRRIVTVGPGYGNDIVVERGLQPGDEVIVVGQNNVTENERLDIANTRTRLAGPAASPPQAN